LQDDHNHAYRYSNIHPIRRKYGNANRTLNCSHYHGHGQRKYHHAKVKEREGVQFKAFLEADGVFCVY
jgi:hypothetical protein